MVLALGALAYSGGLDGQFIHDDLGSIPDNPNIRQLWPLDRALSAPPEQTVSGRPVVSLSLAANYAAGGLAVRGYHLFNLTVHLLSTLVLFGIIRRKNKSGSVFKLH